jgi:hypothetical protein
MRKVILLLLILVAFKSLQAQQVNATIHKPILIYPDTLIFINSYPINNRLNSTPENMPNPYKGRVNQLTKIGPNGKGFDLYQSKPDNMKVLKPDSTNLAITYIPNGYRPDDKITFLRKPKMNLLLDTLSEIKLSVRPSTFPINK